MASNSSILNKSTHLISDSCNKTIQNNENYPLKNPNFDNLSIIFNDSSLVYYNNDEIHGIIVLQLKENILGKGIFLHFIGEKQWGMIVPSTFSKKPTDLEENGSVMFNLPSLPGNNANLQRKYRARKLRSSSKIIPENLKDPTPDYDIPNFKIPIILFKKSNIAGGRYEFPFIFKLNDLKLPTIEFENTERTFYFSNTYKLIIEFELEEDKNSDNDYIERSNSLRCEYKIKILLNDNDNYTSKNLSNVDQSINGNDNHNKEENNNNIEIFITKKKILGFPERICNIFPKRINMIYHRGNNSNNNNEVLILNDTIKLQIKYDKNIDISAIKKYKHQVELYQEFMFKKYHNANSIVTPTANTNYDLDNSFNNNLCIYDKQKKDIKIVIDKSNTLSDHIIELIITLIDINILQTLNYKDSLKINYYLRIFIHNNNNICCFKSNYIDIPLRISPKPICQKYVHIDYNRYAHNNLEPNNVYEDDIPNDIIAKNNIFTKYLNDDQIIRMPIVQFRLESNWRNDD